MLQHELTHIPYRPWCVHCRRNRGRSDPHRKKDQKAEEETTGAITTFSTDYTFFFLRLVTLYHTEMKQPLAMQSGGSRLDYPSWRLMTGGPRLGTYIRRRLKEGTIQILYSGLWTTWTKPGIWGKSCNEKLPGTTFGFSC